MAVKKEQWKIFGLKLLMIACIEPVPNRIKNNSMIGNIAVSGTGTDHWDRKRGVPPKQGIPTRTFFKSPILTARAVWSATGPSMCSYYTSNWMLHFQHPHFQLLLSIRCSASPEVRYKILF